MFYKNFINHCKKLLHYIIYLFIYLSLIHTIFSSNCTCMFDLQNTKNNYNVQFLHKNTVKKRGIQK